MSVFFEHEIYIGNKQSYTDWGLVLSKKTIGFPKPRKNKIKVEGVNGDVDLSTSLMGEMLYDNRKLSFEFTVLDMDKWHELKNEITQRIHGQKVEVEIWDEPNWIYQGVAEINEFRTNKLTGTLVIEVDCQPFKTQSASKSFTFTRNLEESFYINAKSAEKLKWRGNGHECQVTINGSTFTVPADHAVRKPNVPVYLNHGNESNTIRITSTYGGEQTLEFLYEVGEI